MQKNSHGKTFDHLPAGLRDGAVPTRPLAVPVGNGLDLATQGIVVVDKTGRISAINAAALRLLHCVNTKVQGEDFWEVVPEDVSEQHQVQTLEVLAASDHHAFQAHHEFEDQWLEYSFIRCAEALVVNLTDVTPIRKLQRSLERSERHNQLIFGSNPSPMWIFDAQSLCILTANDAAISFYEIERQAFLKLKMGDLFPDGQGTALLSTMAHQPGAGDEQLKQQICQQKKGDGQLVLVELAYGRISWREHRAILVSTADVTERHFEDRALRRENMELERTLTMTSAELENTNRDLAAFTYGLSHDLQGPLHTADGFASLLAEKYATVLDGAGRHYINRIHASTRKLAGLVDDLRELVQLPQISGVTEIVDLSALCETLVDDLRRRYPGRLLTFERPPGLLLAADRHLVTTALTHLLDNAWKFTAQKPEGWVKVDLLVGAQPDERILQISDNGTGFDAAYIDKLFTAFQRLHSAVEFPGNGLGLAIVKRVADRHAGRVWAKTSSTGANFFMSFPKGGVPAAANTPSVTTSSI